MTIAKKAFNYTVLPILLVFMMTMFLPVLLFTDKISMIQQIIDVIFESNEGVGETV
jgi:hypothetical protein